MASFSVFRHPMWVVLLAMAAFTNCNVSTPPEEARTITVLAAASTGEALEELAQRFGQQNDCQVVLSTGPSNGLAKQVISGAPADLYLSANRQWAEAVAAAGLAVESIDLLTNQIVLVVPRGNPAGITGPADLQGPHVTSVAIAGQHVPAGIYAEQALRQLGLLEKLQQAGRLVYGSDVRVATTYVERGEAEAGIVYATDAALSDQVELVEVLETREPIRYPLVLLRSGAGRLPKQFFDFLQTDEAATLFERYGFQTAAGPGADRNSNGQERYETTER